MRLVVIALASIAAACGLSQPHAGGRVLRVAIHRDPVAFLPLRIAETLGFYKAEGITVQLSEVSGGAKALEALLGGSVDVAAGSMSDAVAVSAEGHSVRAFVVLYRRPAAAIAVAPGLGSAIRTIGDLKGRTVGVSAPGSASHQILNSLLAANGLSPDDVSTVSIGMSASSIAALEHGTVHAAVLVASAIAAFEHRHPDTVFLADTRTAAGATRVFGTDVFPSLSLLAEDDWLRANGDAARKLARAVRNGMRWVQREPPERVREMIPEASRTSVEADLTAIREAQQLMSQDGMAPPGSARLVEKFVAISNPKVRAARVDPDSIYTNRYLDAK